MEIIECKLILTMNRIHLENAQIFTENSLLIWIKPNHIQPSPVPLTPIALCIFDKNKLKIRFIVVYETSSVLWHVCKSCHKKKLLILIAYLFVLFRFSQIHIIANNYVCFSSFLQNIFLILSRSVFQHSLSS